MPRPRVLVGRLAGANASNASNASNTSRPAAILTSRVFSSSSFDDGDDQTPRDSAAVLRAIRNGEDVAAATADEGIDYRYRSSSTADETSVVKSPLDLWGETAARTERERQRQNDARSQCNPMPPLRSLLDEDDEDDVNCTQRPTLSSIYNQDRDGRRLSSRRGQPDRPDGNRNGQTEKKFVSFFDEVDDLLERRRADKIGTSMNRGAMGSTLANLLERLDNYPDPDDGGRQNDTVQGQSSMDSGQASGLGDDFSASEDRDGGSYSSIGGLSGTGGATSIFSKDHNLAPPNERARSIFDTDDGADFEPEPVNPNAYDKEIFEQYETLMREELERERFVQMRTRGMKNTTEDEKQEFLRPVYKWLLDNQRTIPYELPTLQEACQNSGPLSSDGIGNGKGESYGDRFRGELEKQKASFLEETALTPEQYEVAEKAVQVLATNCAKRARAAPVEVMWEKIKESGMMPTKDVMSTLLYVVGTGGSVLSTFSKRDSHRRGSKFSSISSLFSGISGTRMNDSVGANRDDTIEEQEEEEDDSVKVQDEVALCHDMLYEPTDNSTSLRVKGLISKGDAQGAEKLLETFASKEGTVVRLRSYLPILSLYCQRGEVNSALKLFKQMRNTDTVHLEPENYVLLISALAEHGYFREDAQPIDIASDLGYNHPSGPKLFDELVTEMAEDIMEITAASARKMYNSLAIGFKDQHEGRNLQEMHSLAGMRVFNDVAEYDEVVASRIQVEHDTGVCPRTKARLRLVMLDEEQRKQLRASLAKLAASETAKFARGNKRKEKEDAQRAVEEMSRFANWLETRTGEPFTAIVDGANAAYYMQNFDQGRFNYHQIQFVVDALIKLKENPLVVLPYKYGFDSFKINTGFAGELQRLTEEEIYIRDG